MRQASDSLGGPVFPVTKSPIADRAKNSNCITHVSMQSTYTQNLSKKRQNIDIFTFSVDPIDTFYGYVEKTAEFRHN